MGRSTIVLLACLFALSLASAEVGTQVDIANSPPYFLQDIPDILIMTNSPLINAFDLDDYFDDANGDDLTFGHTELSNIIVTINSENQVSFYPDIGYTGKQPMQFNASDPDFVELSNIFQVEVGLDIEAPQWSNPKKNRISVYQNYHVTFSTEWTDNVELAEYIFSINQGLGWQNKTVTPFTGTANISTSKVQISAEANKEISWMFYAKDASGNQGMTAIQKFTVKEFTISTEEYEGGEDFSGGEGGDTTEGGVSYGGEEAKLDYFKEGILAKNLEVDIRSVKVSMKQGANLTKVVQIINTGNVNIKINASLKNLGTFATLSESNFEIAPGETYELLVDFTILKTQMPDQYFGFLHLDYGDRISIPIVIDVKKFESEIKIDVILTEKSLAVRAGETVTALIIIKNLRDISSTPSQFYYAIKDFNGNIIESKNEELVLSSFFEEERSLVAPEEAPDGEYIFYARIMQEGDIDLDSDTFLLGARFKIIALLKKFLYPVTILGLLTILFLLYAVYKRNKKKKRLLELYLLLNQLRTLVKEEKTKEAMDIYKRIKLTYGQHVSKNFIEDEVKLKEELGKISKVLSESQKVAAAAPSAPKPATTATKPATATAPKPATKPTTATATKPATKPTTAATATKPATKPATVATPKPATTKPATPVATPKPTTPQKPTIPKPATPATPKPKPTTTKAAPQTK